MGITVTGKMIGGRNNYNHLQTTRRQYRRNLIVRLMAHGINTNRDIREWLAENYPTLPQSKRTIQLDLVTLKEKFRAEGRCTDCGQLPVSASEGMVNR